ncbi:MAG: hypothetical protein ACI8RD_011801 [Bacillariaceae sp.]|jgi:hypothetical protein
MLRVQVLKLSLLCCLNFLLIESLLLIRSSDCFLLTDTTSSWGIITSKRRKYSSVVCLSPTCQQQRSNCQRIISITTKLELNKNKNNVIISSRLLKKNVKQSSQQSILQLRRLISLLGGLFSSNNNNNNNSNQKGFETSLVLGNKQRRNRWINDISKQFPWIPKDILSTCVDEFAISFEKIAPKDLKKFLRRTTRRSRNRIRRRGSSSAGGGDDYGLDKIRSKIENDIIRNLQDQSIIQQLPLKDDEKNMLLMYLVHISLDYFFPRIQMDTALTLATSSSSWLSSPYTKLQVLEQQRQEIISQYSMNFWQLTWYKLRYQSIKKSITVGLLCMWTVYVSYKSYQSHIDVAIQYLYSTLLLPFMRICIEGISIIKYYYMKSMKIIQVQVLK